MKKKPKKGVTSFLNKTELAIIHCNGVFYRELKKDEE